MVILGFAFALDRCSCGSFGRPLPWWLGTSPRSEAVGGGANHTVLTATVLVFGWAHWSPPGRSRNLVRDTGSSRAASVPSASHAGARGSATSFLSTSFLKMALPPACPAPLLTVRTVIHGPGTPGGCVLGNMVTLSKGGADTESGVSKSTQVIIPWSCFSVTLYSSKHTGRRAKASVSNRAAHVNGKCAPDRFSWGCSRILYFMFCRSNFRLYSDFGVCGNLLFVNSQPIKIQRHFLRGYGLLFLPRWVSLLNVLFMHNASLNVLLNT